MSIYQFLEFERTYVPISPPVGPTEGVERYQRALRQDASLGELARDLGVEVRRRLTNGSSLTALGEQPTERTSPTKQHSRTILFVGDSLIAGVGCSRGETILPRRVAHQMAQALGADVHWRAYSNIGGDVKQLQSTVLPQVDNFLASWAGDGAAASGGPVSSSNGAPVDCVVVMCGLNDWKRVCNGNKSPESFQRDLEVKEQHPFPPRPLRHCPPIFSSISPSSRLHPGPCGGAPHEAGPELPRRAPGPAAPLDHRFLPAPPDRHPRPRRDLGRAEAPFGGPPGGSGRQQR